jgi:hypothetical protein
MDERLEAVCGPFEAAWKNRGPDAAPPRIEDYLPDTTPGERAVFLKELVALDLCYRRLSGESPRWEEYRARFPELPERLRVLFKVSAATPADHLARTGKEASTGDGNGTATGRPAAVAIPGFDLLGEVGRGGMGVVYRARHTRLDRIVALKMIRTGA